MKRLGSSIDNLLCDRLKGRLDADTEYTSQSLIDIYRNDPDFTLDDLLYWIFGNSDWVGNTEKEKDTIDKLNSFIENNPPRFENFKIMSCMQQSCLNNFMQNYYLGKTDEQKEQIKQELCNVFGS